MKVHWTDTAIRRLQELHNHIAKEAPQLAGSVTLRLLQRSRQLEMAGRSGRKVPEYWSDEVREILERPYRIIYLIKGDRIDVLTIRHYRQLLPSDLRELADS